MEDIISKSIKAKVIKDFSTFERHFVLTELNNLAEYFFKHETKEFLEDGETIEKIFLGILKLSQGKISNFHETIIQAKKDWRNVLYWNE